jgi:hypothetical protein
MGLFSGKKKEKENNSLPVSRVLIPGAPTYESSSTPAPPMAFVPPAITVVAPHTKSSASFENRSQLSGWSFSEGDANSIEGASIHDSYEGELFHKGNEYYIIHSLAYTFL